MIVLDEPLSSLDASAQAQIANLLVDLTRDLGLGLLLISHDLAIVRHVADAVSVMYLGDDRRDGADRRVWSAPLHPYTEALINASRTRTGAASCPRPSPARCPTRPAAGGCRFHPRCPYAFERCAHAAPRSRRSSIGVRAACWLAAEPGRHAVGRDSSSSSRRLKARVVEVVLNPAMLVRGVEPASEPRGAGG